MLKVIFLGFFALLCLAIVGCGVYFVAQHQQHVLAYSEQTTAIVLQTRVKSHRRRHSRAGESSIGYEPVVKYRYQVGGQEYTNSNVFPYDYRIGGNLGRLAAKAPLDPFEVDQQTTAYFKPESPSDACLIRRPQGLLYIVILIPVVVASCLVAFLLPASRRRRAGVIAVVWHLVGLACTAHYLLVAGANFHGGVLLMFGVYTQIGLIPVALALPKKKTEFTARLDAAIWGSLVGSFVGFWMGVIVSFVVQLFSATATTRLRCMGFGVAIPAGLLFLLGLVSQQKTKRRKRRRPKVRQPAEVKSRPAPDGPVPYGIDKRPLPVGEQIEILLPEQVGPFWREPMDEPDDIYDLPIYANYESDNERVFVELGVCENPAAAQTAIRVAKEETEADFSDKTPQISLDTDPSYYQTSAARGAFIAWTRGRYYFSAHARGGQRDLDRFMQAFPF